MQVKSIFQSINQSINQINPDFFSVAQIETITETTIYTKQY